jgi:hypothetical protein
VRGGQGNQAGEREWRKEWKQGIRRNEEQKEN